MGTKIITWLGLALVMAIGLYYYYGGAAYINALAGGTATVVNSYGGLMKDSYPRT